MSEAAPKPAKLPLTLQLSYGFGSTAFGAGGAALSTALLQLYFNQVIGLPAVWVGAAIMATIVVDALIDPMIGRFSDGLRSPLGRRHTLMYLAALPAALGFFMMWHAPHSLSPAALLAFMIAMLVFVNVSFSFYEIPSVALAPELAPDYEQRTRLLGFRWMFLIFGGAAMNFVLYQVFLRQDAANPLGVLNRERYGDFGLTAALVIFTAILVSTAATHGRIRTLHRPPVAKVPLREGLRQIRAALSHRPLVLMMLVGLFMGFGAGTTAGLSAYFNLHFWGLKPQQISFLVLGGLAASVIALGIAPSLGVRFGKKRAMVGLYLGWLLTAVGPLSLGLLGMMPPNGSTTLLLVLVGNYTLSLILALCCHMLLGSSIADTIDDISVRTNVRSEGLLFGAYSVLDKFSNGGGAFVAGAILSGVAFPPHAQPGTVDRDILRQMAMVNLPIVIVFNLLSIFCLSRYPLTRADHERNAAILASRRAADLEAQPGAAAPSVGELGRSAVT